MRGWEKFIQHVWDTNSPKVITGFVYNLELLPEVYLMSRDRPLYFGDDPNYYPDRSARVCIFDQFCKIYNNFLSRYIGAYPFSVVTIDLI